MLESNRKWAFLAAYIDGLRNKAARLLKKPGFERIKQN